MELKVFEVTAKVTNMDCSTIKVYIKARTKQEAQFIVNQKPNVIGIKQTKEISETQLSIRNTKATIKKVKADLKVEKSKKRKEELKSEIAYMQSELRALEQKHNADNQLN